MTTKALKHDQRTRMRLWAPALLAATLTACGGGGGEAGANSGARVATFIDAKVEGLTYESKSKSGVTDRDGNFEYMPGEEVTFSVGKLVLGSTKPLGDKVTPLDLVPDARDASDDKVTRILRTLQTLDADADPENGIKINPAARAYANKGTVVRLSSSSTTDEAVKARLYTTDFTRSKEEAREHFEKHKDTKPNSGSTSSGTSTSTSIGKSKITAQPANTAGRLLASNCFQCHGTLGTGGFDSIRGGDAGEVLEFLSKPAGGDIMAAHAQGFTRAQLTSIIAYLKQ